ncbi:MAG: DEAD/DEAH box helicase [Treponema sp.]|nr:DEAD/DEAH box helicase [Treponema sp.]
MGESFNELGIGSSFIEKLKERSITEPTAIQKLVIPSLLAKGKIVFRSATGTGKTFAYLLPALQTAEKNTEKRQERGPSILVCAPTLELCSQIKTEADFLSDLPSALLIGSASLDKQIENLKRNKPALVVGNPGRLLTLIKMKKLPITELRFLILDEADRLTARECLEDTKELLALIGRYAKEDLSLAACSATVSIKTRRQLEPLFETAEIIESDDHEILRERIEHWALFSEKRKKVQTLRSLLAALRTKKSRFKALVFTSRNDEAGNVLSKLQYHHVSAAGLFGKIEGKPLASAERREALDFFRQGKIEALVSTDLAARGLDIPDISCVIALDVPENGEIYIHRCGRTGRAGKRGIMISIGDETNLRRLASLEKRLKIRVQPKYLYQGRVCVPPQMVNAVTPVQSC